LHPRNVPAFGSVGVTIYVSPLPPGVAARTRVFGDTSAQAFWRRLPDEREAALVAARQPLPSYDNSCQACIGNAWAFIVVRQRAKECVRYADADANVHANDSKVDMNQNELNIPSPPVEVYPGAPLRAVAIELRFRRTLDAVSRMGAFQRQHPEFPRATVRDDNDSETVLMLDETPDKGVGISPTRLAVIDYVYSDGFRGFRRWAMPLLDHALQVLDISTFSGVLYRYENLIEADATRFDQVLNVNFPTPEFAKAGRPRRIVWQQDWPKGDVIVYISTKPGALELDISSESRGPIGRSTIADAIDEAHRMGRYAFEALITPEFRDTIRREGGRR